MRTCLLVSANRSKSLEEAKENMELAISLKKARVFWCKIEGSGRC